MRQNERIKESFLSDKNYQLLMRIVNNNRLFDRKDNTFKVSNRKASKALNVSPSKVDRLFRVLRQSDLVRDVRLYNGCVVPMLSPRFLFISYSRFDRWITAALFELTSYANVRQWREHCRSLNAMIDPETGEVKVFNWYYIDAKADQYSCLDRCYRKGTKETYYVEEDPDTAQNYNVNDVKTDPVSEDDLTWFNTINKKSDYHYPLIDRRAFKVVPLLSVYSVKMTEDIKK